MSLPMTSSKPSTQSASIIRFDRTGGPEVMRFEMVTLPPPQSGEVRVRQEAIGVNFMDLYFRTGLYPAALPSGLGIEAAGVIQALGFDVHGFKIGDRVVYAKVALGAYATRRNVPADWLVKLPRQIASDTAAAMLLKGLTVQYLFRQTYRLQGGETILFHAAAGGVGLIACQWAKALGVKLIGTVSSPEKAALAKANGAWATIDYSRENIAERVLELTDGKKLPVVYDSIGKDTWEASLACIEPRGLMISYGNASGPVSDVNLGVLAQNGSLYVTRPTFADYFPTREKLQVGADELFGLVLKKKIKIQIGQRYALRDVAQAHIDLAGRKTAGSSVLLP